jgi:hypothetical protein
MAEKKPPRLVSRVTLAGSGSGGALRETPKQARREADPTDLPPVQDQYAFLRNCCPFNRFADSQGRFIDWRFFAVSGNFNAAPNETLANHRRRLSNHWLDLGLRVNRGFWGANDLYY